MKKLLLLLLVLTATAARGAVFGGGGGGTTLSPVMQQLNNYTTLASLVGALSNTPSGYLFYEDFDRPNKLFLPTNALVKFNAKSGHEIIIGGEGVTNVMVTNGLLAIAITNQAHPNIYVSVCTSNQGANWIMGCRYRLSPTWRTVGGGGFPTNAAGLGLHAGMDAYAYGHTVSGSPGWLYRAFHNSIFSDFGYSTSISIWTNSTGYNLLSGWTALPTTMTDGQAYHQMSTNNVYYTAEFGRIGPRVVYLNLNGWVTNIFDQGGWLPYIWSVNSTNTWATWQLDHASVDTWAVVSLDAIWIRPAPPVPDYATLAVVTNTAAAIDFDAAAGGTLFLSTGSNPSFSTANRAPGKSAVFVLAATAELTPTWSEPWNWLTAPPSILSNGYLHVVSLLSLSGATNGIVASYAQTR